jgi:signal transduction histidine kinase
MIKGIQTAHIKNHPASRKGTQVLQEDLSLAASALETYLVNPRVIPEGTVRSIIDLVKQSRKVFQDYQARLDQANKNEARLSMQYNIAHFLAESNTVSKAAPHVMRMICEHTGWEYGALWQVEPGGEILTNKGAWHVEGKLLSEFAERMRYSIISSDESNLPGVVLKTGEPLWISSLKKFHSDYASEAEKAGLHVAYVIPVKSGGRINAILECYSSQSQPDELHLVAMLNAIGDQVGVFLERKILEEDLAARANQQHLLAEAGIALSTSLELDERFQNITHVIVPELADWCTIDIIEPDMVVRRVAVAHVDPRNNELLLKLQPTRKVDLSSATDARAQTLITGQSLLIPEITPEMIKNTNTDPAVFEIINQLNPVSSMVLPLFSHGKITGVFTFVHSDSGRRYTSSDLALAEDIVRRMSLALDNAFLYEETKKTNADLEKYVDERTLQLKAAIRELTNQIAERQNAEEQVRILNKELEQRIAERTSELEILNLDLNKELADRQRTSLALKKLLKRTTELYRISQTIGMVRTPAEVLNLLVSSSYLKDVSRASIAILEGPWVENNPPPEKCFILAEWNRGTRLPRFKDQHFTLEEYGVTQPVPYEQPIVITDIQSIVSLPDRVRRRFMELKTHSLIILPLIAGGEWYGLLSLHFKTRRMTSLDDLRHVRGLVDEAALVIKNMRLLETESQARMEAERANDLKLKFLGMISHELRTPLTSIKGFVTTLLAEDVEWPKEKSRDFLETINAEADKLHDLIEQLLDLSRIEAGILRITPLKIDLDHVFDLAKPQLQVITAEHKLVFEVASNLPPVLGDEQRLSQVLTNLVNNAAKFSLPGTTIKVCAFPLEQELRVDVIDQGPGIQPDDRKFVFTAFRQLSSSGDNRKKGAGLGLAICKGLIEAQHGRIWIQDQEGPGTVVSFTLPLFTNQHLIVEAD